MNDLADISQLLHGAEDTSKLQNITTFENFLIYGQALPFDVMRYAPFHTNKVKLIDMSNVNLYWSGTQLQPGDEFTAAEYCELPNKMLLIEPCMISKTLDDIKLVVQFVSTNGKESTQEKIFTFTAYQFVIRADYSRTGKLSDPPADKTSWTWGKAGTGPIMLVDCAKEESEEDRCYFQVVLEGPQQFPQVNEGQVIPILMLENPADLGRIKLYDEAGELCLGTPHKSQVRWFPLNFSEKGNSITFYAYASEYPNRDFDGFLTVCIKFAVKTPKTATLDSYLIPNKLFYASVEFKVSPWIMTPNTLKADKLYVSDVTYNYYTSQGWISNARFIHQLVESIGQDNVVVIPDFYVRGDSWMQDEIEFGYSQKPEATMNVVLDSPRNRGLDTFPILDLYGKGKMGMIAVGGTGKKNSLDSFGNLEVSPPVKGYPLGRIYHGGNLDDPEGRQMMLAMRDFLVAQQVQKPIMLHTDWLLVGHVDEFISFVPVRNSKQANPFKMLLASPRVFWKILQDLANEGHGNAVLFKGKNNLGCQSMQTTVAQILNDEVMVAANTLYQAEIDRNKALLKAELHLEDNDIIEIPTCFYSDQENGSVIKSISIEQQIYQASALMPGMVNMAVFNEHLMIGDPFGPVINGKDPIKQYVENVLTPLGLQCHFIDDWYAYHIQEGEVHCATNVLRQPFKMKWWELEQCMLSV